MRGHASGGKNRRTGPREKNRAKGGWGRMGYAVAGSCVEFTQQSREKKEVGKKCQPAWRSAVEQLGEETSRLRRGAKEVGRE